MEREGRRKLEPVGSRGRGKEESKRKEAECSETPARRRKTLKFSLLAENWGEEGALDRRNMLPGEL